MKYVAFMRIKKMVTYLTIPLGLVLFVVTLKSLNPQIFPMVDDTLLYDFVLKVGVSFFVSLIPVITVRLIYRYLLIDKQISLREEHEKVKNKSVMTTLEINNE